MADEAAFWRRRLTQDSDELQRRRDPRGAVLDPGLIETINRLDRATVTVLDVGSGPLTSVGAVCGDATVEVTAIDPLGVEYMDILNDLGIDAPFPPQACAGEEIGDFFDPQSFDIAFAQNALDHAVDPISVIDAMLEVVKPGGFVILSHFRNEAEESAYGHLHHWNFDERDGRCIVWRRGGPSVDVGNHIGLRGTTTARTRKIPPDAKEWVTSIIAKQ